MKPTVQNTGVQCYLDISKCVSKSNVGVQCVVGSAASTQCDMPALSPKSDFMTSESALSDISEERTIVSTDTYWETESS